MSPAFENDSPNFTPEQMREFREMSLQAQRFTAVAHIVGGVARSPEHEKYEKYEKYLESLKAQGIDQSDSSKVVSEQKSSDIQYKSAQIHNPINGKLKDVTVIEDSACQVNFISPRLARDCNLKIMPTSPIAIATLMGDFTTDKGAEVSWLGRKGRNGSAWFYIPPESYSLDIMLVGTEFQKDYPAVFDQALLKPGHLSVQARMTKGEQSQVQADEELANAQAAELEKKKKKQGQQKEAQKQQQKQKHGESSSKSYRSRRT